MKAIEQPAVSSVANASGRSNIADGTSAVPGNAVLQPVQFGAGLSHLTVDAFDANSDRHEAFRRVRFFGSLDGLRAVSILAVIWHHTAAAALPEIGLLQRGNRGVMLFFVISAFLISTLLLRAKERNPLNVPRFWARRALRIMPLFYAVLGLYIVMVYWLERDAAVRQAFFANVPAFATFTSNWFVDLDNARVIFYFAWSLAAEEQFYLCWPWIERYCSKAWPVVVALGALIASQCAGLLYAAGTSDALALKMIASIPAAILCGVILAHGLNSPRMFNVLYGIVGRRGSAIGAAVLVLLFLALEPVFGFWGELISAVVLTLLVASCVVREDNDLAPLLQLRPVAWIGTVSYGIYLVHMLSVSVVRRVLGSFGMTLPYGDFIGGALLSIGVASLSYLTFERYFLRRKERWFSERPSQPRAETLPATSPMGVAANQSAPVVATS